MSTINPNFIPERSSVNSLGTRDEPWERANIENLGNLERLIDVNDLATTSDVEANTPNNIPTPLPFVDNGKIVIARGGMLVLSDYPKTAMPPTNTEDAGKVLRIGMDGVPRLEKCATLPEVTPYDEGSTLRIVGGEIMVRRGNSHGDLNPTPIAPEEDGMTIVSENGQWVLKSTVGQYNLPTISPEDVGKFVVLVRETENGPIEVRYMDPPLATDANIGAIPPISGNANHYLNGNLEWKMVTPGNNGHYRLGDIKPTTRHVEAPWLECNGAGVGSQPSGAVYHDDIYKPLYALLDGTLGWEVNWNNNVQQLLPTLPWCQICYLPDAQAPAPFAAIFEAEYANGGNSFFEIQFSKDKLSWPGLTYNSAENLGFWRLGGSLPAMVSTSGDSYPTDGESIMFDVSEVINDFTPGAWYWRARQKVGGSISSTINRNWQYGTSVVIGE